MHQSNDHHLVELPICALVGTTGVCRVQLPLQRVGERPRLGVVQENCLHGRLKQRRPQAVRQRVTLQDSPDGPKGRPRESSAPRQVLLDAEDETAEVREPRNAELL